MIHLRSVDWTALTIPNRLNASITFGRAGTQDSMGNNFPKVAKITDFGPGRPDERERMIEVGRQRTRERR